MRKDTQALIAFAVFVPKAHGLEPVVALIESNPAPAHPMTSEIAKMAEVRVFRAPTGLPDGHVGKLARAYFATMFGDDVVSIVDIDFYLLWFREWSAHLACVPENGILALGYNRFVLDDEHE